MTRPTPGKPNDDRMATCPRCMGALTENHRCPRGRFSRITDSLTSIVIGGVIGGMVAYGVTDQPTAALVLSAVALGAVLANAIRQAIGPNF